MTEVYENSGLVLRTVDLQTYNNGAFNSSLIANVENEIGKIECYGQLLTFNLNWREVLGDLYYKYKRFNLKLCSLSIRQSTVNNNTDVVYSIWLSGNNLNFPNNSYDIVSQKNNNKACMGVCTLITTNTGVATQISNNMITIERPPELGNLVIELKNGNYASTLTDINGNTYREKFNQGLGHMTMLFDIYGVIGSEQENNNMGNDSHMSYEYPNNMKDNKIINNTPGSLFMKK